MIAIGTSIINAPTDTIVLYWMVKGSQLGLEYVVITVRHGLIVRHQLMWYGADIAEEGAGLSGNCRISTVMGSGRVFLQKYGINEHEHTYIGIRTLQQKLKRRNETRL